MTCSRDCDGSDNGCPACARIARLEAEVARLRGLLLTVECASKAEADRVGAAMTGLVGLAQRERG